jgi:hypothetical protein
MYGPQRLLEDLQALGYEAKLQEGGSAAFVVISAYEVPIGRFTGRTVELAIPATPDFPRTVGASIHIMSAPHLFDYADTVTGVRNIIQSPLGDEWRYWSHNFGWRGERSTRVLMNQIKGIFANA